jgi:hypothetical protein
MVKQKIFGSDNHPIFIQLKQRIVNKLIDNIHQVKYLNQVCDSRLKLVNDLQSDF